MRIRKVAGVLIGIAALFVLAAPAAAQDKMLANAGVGYLYFHGATTTVDSASGTKSYPKGFMFSAAGRIHDRLSGVVEFGASFDSSLGGTIPGVQIATGVVPAPCSPVPSCALTQVDAHGSMKIWNLNTGIRFGTGSGKKWEAFGQFLIGWQRRSGQFYYTDPTPAELLAAAAAKPPRTPQGTRIPGTNPATETGSVANDGLNLQPGGGMDFWFTKKMGVRFQGDYERIKADTALEKFFQSNQVPSRWTNNYRFVVSVVFQGVKK